MGDDAEKTAFAWKLGLGVVGVGVLVWGGTMWSEQREAAKWAAMEARTEAHLRESDAQIAESRAKLCALNGDEEACAEWEAFKEARPEDAAAIERKLAAD